MYCFTPLLVWGFTAAGLAVFTAYLDYVLMPALFISMGLFYFGYNQYQKNKTVQMKRIITVSADNLHNIWSDALPALALLLLHAVCLSELPCSCCSGRSEPVGTAGLERVLGRVHNYSVDLLYRILVFQTGQEIVQIYPDLPRKSIDKLNHGANYECITPKDTKRTVVSISTS